MLYRNLKYYLMLIMLNQLFNIMVYGQKFIPEPRMLHTAVLIDNKIYYIGGDNPNKTKQNPESDIFYLDVNGNDRESFLTWVDLKVRLPQTSSHTANVGGFNQDSIYIIGGAHSDEKNTNYLYKFDTKTNELSVPVIQGKAPPTRIAMRSVSYEGKIYIFGGRTYSLNSVYVKQIDILDTINLNWQVGSLVNSPVALAGYSATLVNGIIYYIGGRSQNDVFSPMTDIFQYDIVSDKWSLKKAIIADTNAVPGSRTGHSAILYEGKIYVYGGMYYNADILYHVPAKVTFVMLDTITLVWSVPAYNNSDNAPKLVYHSASSKGALMILAFGVYADLPSATDQSNNSTHYFYLNEPIIGWRTAPLSEVSTNTPSSTISIVTKSDTPIPSSQNTMSKTVIFGVSVGSVLVVLTIFVACSLTYRHIKRNQTKIKRESNHPDS